MARYLIALVFVFAFSTVTTIAFGAKKGFYIGGSMVTQTASGDLDGKSTLISDTGDRAGFLGKLDSGSGLALDLGYNFSKNFGFEFYQTVSTHTASHQSENNKTDAAISAILTGIRLSGPLGDSFDVFTRLGLGTVAVAYEKYGHKGTLVGQTFTSSSDGMFILSGSGFAYSVGAEWMVTKRLGFGIGYTVFDVTLDEGEIEGQKVKIDKSPKAKVMTSDFTVLWHF